MQIARKNSLFYFLTAKTLLLARAVLEFLRFRVGTQLPFHSEGFAQFGSGHFVAGDLAKRHSAQLISLLDDIESKHQQNPLAMPASFAAQGYSCEFISENIFYSKKLGPRLRITYDINSFEAWPDLARQIILSENYRSMLKSHFGTLSGVHKCYIEKTFLNGSEPEWHVDSISEIGRLLFFLNDVDESNAPMEYILKSNQDSQRDYDKIKLRHLKTAESWTPYHLIQPADGIRRLKGKAGESFFFDARGVHRSTLARAKPRYALMISFTPKTFSNWFFDLNRGSWPAGTRDLASVPPA